MIVEYIRYAVPADQQSAFIAGYAAAKEPLLRSSHALSCEVSRCIEDPAQFIVRIEWTSVEDHMSGFRSSPEFRFFFQHIRAYVGMIEEMRHYQPL